MSTGTGRKIVKARAQLLLRKPFFGFLSTHLKVIESNNMLIPTMGTNGEYLFYDAGFVEKCTDAELQTIISHEVLHLALGHLWRVGTREKMKWNIAADAVVNWHLQEQGFVVPAGAVKMSEAENLSAEELYVKLKDLTETVGKLLDDHESWGKQTAGGRKASKAGEMGDIATKLAIAEKAAKQFEKKWKHLTAQARQIEKSQGRGMGSLEELIDELIEPQLSWKELLRNAVVSAVKNDYRLIPPNRKHLWRGIYLPSTYGEEIEIVYAVDTSGSMSADEVDEVKEGLSELKGICDSFTGYRIHLYQCDDGIQQYKELNPYNFDFPKKIRGRGGTSFVPVFEDVKEKGIRPSIIIYFTDGYGTVPETKPSFCPVLWLLTEQGAEEGSGYWNMMEKIGTIIRYRSSKNAR